MFKYSATGNYEHVEPIRDRLAEGLPPFQLLKKSDLEPRWRRISGSRLAMELPDTPWGRAYYSWAVEKLAAQPTSEADPFLGCMLSSMANFREPDSSHREAARCLRSLLEDGVPPRDHVAQILNEVLG